MVGPVNYTCRLSSFDFYNGFFICPTFRQGNCDFLRGYCNSIFMPSVFYMFSCCNLQYCCRLSSYVLYNFNSQVGIFQVHAKWQDLVYTDNAYEMIQKYINYNLTLNEKLLSCEHSLYWQWHNFTSLLATLWFIQCCFALSVKMTLALLCYHLIYLHRIHVLSHFCLV